jgi:hypothetical protein
MITRTHSKSVTFRHAFELKGVDRILPAGSYRVVTDEELIEQLSFPVYRRVSTVIFVPAQSLRASSVEMVAIDPRNLQAAQDRDRAMDQVSEAGTDQPGGGSQSCEP